MKRANTAMASTSSNQQSLFDGQTGQSESKDKSNMPITSATIINQAKIAPKLQIDARQTVQNIQMQMTAPPPSGQYDFMGPHLPQFYQPYGQPPVSDMSPMQQQQAYLAALHQHQQLFAFYRQAAQLQQSAGMFNSAAAASSDLNQHASSKSTLEEVKDGIMSRNKVSSDLTTATASAASEMCADDGSKVGDSSTTMSRDEPPKIKRKLRLKLKKPMSGTSANATKVVNNSDKPKQRMITLQQQQALPPKNIMSIATLQAGQLMLENQQLRAQLQLMQQQPSALQSEEELAAMFEQLRDQVNKYESQIDALKAENGELMEALKDHEDVQEKQKELRAEIAMLTDELDDTRVELSMANRWRQPTHAQLLSMIRVFVQLIRHFLEKCLKENAHYGGCNASQSNYSQFQPGFGMNAGKADDISSVTVTEHLMERSFEDDRRNYFEQVRSLLISKLQSVLITIGASLGNKIKSAIESELSEVSSWCYDTFTQGDADRMRSTPGLKRQATISHSGKRGQIAPSAFSNHGSDASFKNFAQPDSPRNHYTVRSDTQHKAAAMSFKNIAPGAMANDNQSVHKSQVDAQFPTAGSKLGMVGLGESFADDAAPGSSHWNNQQNQNDEVKGGEDSMLGSHFVNGSSEQTASLKIGSIDENPAGDTQDKGSANKKLNTMNWATSNLIAASDGAASESSLGARKTPICKLSDLSKVSAGGYQLNNKFNKESSPAVVSRSVFNTYTTQQDGKSDGGAGENHSGFGGLSAQRNQLHFQEKLKINLTNFPGSKSVVASNDGGPFGLTKVAGDELEDVQRNESMAWKGLAREDMKVSAPVKQLHDRRQRLSPTTSQPRFNQSRNMHIISCDDDDYDFGNQRGPLMLTRKSANYTHRSKMKYKGPDNEQMMMRSFGSSFEDMQAPPSDFGMKRKLSSKPLKDGTKSHKPKRDGCFARLLTPDDCIDSSDEDISQELQWLGEQVDHEDYVDGDESALHLGTMKGYAGDSFILSDQVYQKQSVGRRASGAAISSSNKIDSVSPNSNFQYKTVGEPRKTLPIKIGADIASQEERQQRRRGRDSFGITGEMKPKLKARRRANQSAVESSHGFSVSETKNRPTTEFKQDSSVGNSDIKLSNVSSEKGRHGSKSQLAVENNSVTKLHERTPPHVNKKRDSMLTQNIDSPILLKNRSQLDDRRMLFDISGGRTTSGAGYIDLTAVNRSPQGFRQAAITRTEVRQSRSRSNLSMTNNQGAVVDFEANHDDTPMAITDDEVGSFGGQKRQMPTVTSIDQQKESNMEQLPDNVPLNRVTSSEMVALGAGLLTSNAKSQNLLELGAKVVMEDKMTRSVALPNPRRKTSQRSSQEDDMHTKSLRACRMTSSPEQSSHGKPEIIIDAAEVAHLPGRGDDSPSAEHKNDTSLKLPYDESLTVDMEDENLPKFGHSGHQLSSENHYEDNEVEVLNLGSLLYQRGSATRPHPSPQLGKVTDAAASQRDEEFESLLDQRNGAGAGPDDRAHLYPQAAVGKRIPSRNQRPLGAKNNTRSNTLRPQCHMLATADSGDFLKNDSATKLSREHAGPGKENKVNKGNEEPGGIGNMSHAYASFGHGSFGGIQHGSIRSSSGSTRTPDQKCGLFPFKNPKLGAASVHGSSDDSCESLMMKSAKSAHEAHWGNQSKSLRRRNTCFVDYAKRQRRRAGNLGDLSSNSQRSKQRHNNDYRRRRQQAIKRLFKDSESLEAAVNPVYDENCTPLILRTDDDAFDLQNRDQFGGSVSAPRQSKRRLRDLAAEDDDECSFDLELLVEEEVKRGESDAVDKSREQSIKDVQQDQSSHRSGHFVASLHSGASFTQPAAAIGYKEQLDAESNEQKKHEIDSQVEDRKVTRTISFEEDQPVECAEVLMPAGPVEEQKEQQQKVKKMVARSEALFQTFRNDS